MNLYDIFTRVLTADYTQLKENAASYCLERRGDVLHLFFEKSNGATDWKNNFDFPVRPYHEMKDLWLVHRGFLRVWKSIEPYIAGAVSDPRVKGILIAGYSHGAALAVLCHEYCVFHRPDLAGRVKGYGFGCPRVVWGPLKKRMRARFNGFTVVRNGRDIVTHLPPAVFGFRHVGDMLHIGRDARYGLIEAHKDVHYLKELDDLRWRCGR